MSRLKRSPTAISRCLNRPELVPAFPGRLASGAGNAGDAGPGAVRRKQPSGLAKAHAHDFAEMK